MKKSEKSQGFTLFELLIVIAIIGIIIAVATASYSSVQQKSRDSRRRNDLKAMQNALEQYYSDNNSAYIATCDPGTTYLPSGVPTDPKHSTAYNADFGTNDTASCSTTSYCLCATLEGETNTTGDCGSGVVPTPYVGFFCVQNLQ